MRFRSSRVRAVIALASFLGLLGFAFAEGPTGASVAGRVTDLRGTPLSGASVQLFAGDARTLAIDARSAEDGTFRLRVPGAGRYRVVVSRGAFCTWRLDDLVLAPQEDRVLVVPLQPGVRVTGLVSNAKGEPLSEARVRVDLARQRPPGLRPGSEREGDLRAGKAEAWTDGDGFFDLGVIPRVNGYLIEVAHAAAPRFAVRGDFSGKDAIRRLALTAPAAAEIRGVVRGDDDQPLAGVEAHAIPLANAASPEDPPVVATTGADGVFRLRPLSPGRHRVEVHPPSGVRQFHGPVELGPGVVLDLGVLRTTPGLAIAGRVTERDGMVVSPAKVKAFRQLQGGRTLERVVAADERGRFEIAGLPPGRYRLVTEPDAPFLPAIAEDVEAPAADVAIEVSREAVVTGFAQDRGGAPLEGLVVDAAPRDSSDWRRAQTKKVEITDRDKGAFRISALPAGVWLVRARAAGRRGVLSDPVELRAGEEYGPITLVLERGLALEGRVIDKNSRAAIVGALVAARGAGEASTTTVADGAFRLDGLAPGQVFLDVTHPDYAPASHTAVFDPEQPVAAVVELGPGGRVEGAVKSASGAPAPGVRISVADSRQATIGAVFTNADGAFSFDRVPPGETRVMQLGGAGAPDQDVRTVSVEEGRTQRVDFVLGGVVEGVVTRAGLPAPGVRVTLGQQHGDPKEWRGSDYAIRSSWTGPDGRYRLDGVAPGASTLTLCTGRQLSLRQVDIPAAQATTLDISLPSHLVRGLTIARKSQALLSCTIDAYLKNPKKFTSWGFATTSENELGEAFEVRIGGGEQEQTVSTADGAFEVFVDPAAAYSVRAYARGGENGATELVPGATPDQVKIEVSKSAVLRGRLIAPGGEPAQGVSACLLASRATSCARPLSGEMRFETREEEGTLILAGPGLALQVVAVDEISPEGDGPPNVYDVAFAPAGILEVVLPGDGSFALSEVRSLEGVNLLEWLRMLDQVQQHALPAGRVVRLGGLPVGEVAVVVTPTIGKGQPIVINTEIRRGETVRVEAP